MGKSEKEIFPEGWFWEPDEALLAGSIGFGLSYFVLVAHSFAHPIHWAFSGAGGILSYLGALLWITVRRRRFRRQWGAAPKKAREKR